MKRARPVEAALVALVLAVFVALAVSSLRGDSATFDEPAHLSAAWSHLALGDYRMSPDHPPLVKHVAAAPLLFMEVRVPADDVAWRLRRTHEFGRRLLFRWNDGHRLLVAARCAVVFLGALLALAVFVSARRRWGPWAGMLALLLCAFSPDVLAHARLVTTDLGATLFVFVAIMSWERLAERATWGRLVLAGLATGAAFASKFSALVLVPVLALLAGLVLVPRDPRRWLPRLDARLAGPRLERARRIVAGLVVMVLLTAAVIWTAYGFRRRFSPEPAVNASFDWTRLEPRQPLVAGAVRAARGLAFLPDPYLYGFLRFFRHSEARPAFLLGERSEQGFRWFFPLTFAVKTPVPLMALLVLGLALRGSPALPRAGAFVWIPVAVYAALTLTRGINIGHRHLLPVYPFLFVLAARSAAWARARWSDGARWPAWAVCALAAWAVVTTVRVHPHYLAYFNEPAGGPRNGYRLLVDSSLDWGQDLARLREWAHRHGVPRLKLSYFGTADPEYYRVPADLLPGYMPPVPRKTVREVRPGDVVAVSATNLQGVYIEREALPLMERLRALPPLDQVGWSILIYRPDFAWTIPPAGDTAEPSADLPPHSEDDAERDE